MSAAGQPMSERHSRYASAPSGGMSRQHSRDSSDGSMGSLVNDAAASWMGGSGPMIRAGSGSHNAQVGEFVEGLGPGQVVGRQVLGAPCLGEIQLGLFDRKGHLEVEVIRARGLAAKSGTKLLPAPYVKVYLFEGKTCVEKQRTTISTRRTLDPLYQQQLIFLEHYQGKILQVSGRGPKEGGGQLLERALLASDGHGAVPKRKKHFPAKL